MLTLNITIKATCPYNIL